MEPTRGLIEMLDAEEIDRAREQLPGDKLLAGPQLFDRVCMFMEAGIRHDFPDADQDRIERLLEERLAVAAALEEGD